MKKQILHSLQIRCLAGALLLAAGASTASPLVKDNPALIPTTLTFDCSDPNFLAPWNLLSGSAGAANPHWMAGVPNLSGSAGIPALGTPPLTAPINYNLWVCAWAGSWGPPGGMAPGDDGYTPFNLNGTLTLGFAGNYGNETYVLEQHFTPSPPTPASFATFDGILPWVADASLASQPWPIGPGFFGFYDPGLQFVASGPIGNPATLTEVPGLLSITLQCPVGGNTTLPNFVPNSGRVEAVLNGPAGIPPELSPTYAPWHPTTPIAKQYGPGAAGTLQASLSPLTGAAPNWNGGPVNLLVRSGRNYHLNLYYTTGNFWYSDAINWETQVQNVPNSGFVPACQTTPVIAPMITCDFGGSGCVFPNVIGSVGISSETVWPVIYMGVYDGPLDNHRTTPPGTVMPTSDCNTFAITNVVPSDYFSANWPSMGVASRPYFAQGSMNFGTYSSYEYFATPRLPNLFFYCNQNYDLTDQFCMCPGHVTGSIKITGPPDLYSLPSGIRDMALYSAAAGNFATSGELNNGDHSLSGSSRISASNPDGGGASVLFGGPPPVLTSGGCTFSGNYDLRLAGLKPTTTSIWTPNILDLAFHNGLAAPDQYLNESVRITDNNFTSKTITCGQTIKNDLDYCFGEVLITVVNNAAGIPAAEFTGLSVGGSGQPASAAYGVSFSATGRVTSDLPTGSKGQIRLFLPEGKYSFQTTVGTPGGGSHNQPEGSVTVTCGAITTCSNGCLDVLIGEIPPCTTASAVSVSGLITLDTPSDNITVSYTVNPNHLTPVDVTSYYTAAGGSGNAFTIPGIPLGPCLNQIDITVVDHTTGVSTTVTRYTSQPSATPPTITGCQDIVVNASSSGAPVSVPYSVTAAGGCPGTTLTCTPASPGPFPLGTTLVTCTAIDACSNTTTCTFNVTVRTCATIESDSFSCTNTPDPNARAFNYSFTVNNPTFGAPVGSLMLTPASPCFTFDMASLPAAIAPGASQSFSTIITVGPDCPQQLCFDIALYDDFGEYRCTQRHCFDNPALPRIACPLDITNNCTSDAGAQVGYAIPAATSLCCTNVTVTCSPLPGLFPIGVTPVTCTAVDGCGGTNTCTFNVTVVGRGDTQSGRWVKADGTPSFPSEGSRANAIAVDASGNSFVGGTFTGTATFTPAVGFPILLASMGGEDAFLAKYDTSGKLLWVQQAGGFSGDDEALGVATDSQGNCYVTGSFTDSATFGLQMIYGFPGGKHIFLAKYDPSGNLLWVLADGGVGPDAGEGVAVDTAGNAYITGTFHGVATFDTLAGSPVTLWGWGSRDCFIAKYTPAGKLQWVVGSDGVGSYLADARGIAVNGAGTLAWITGFFAGTPQFAGTPALYPSTGVGNAFVAQCSLATSTASPNPTWTWARQTFCPSGSCGSHDGRQIGVDNAGNCYFTAIFNGTVAIAADNLTPMALVPSVAPAGGNLFYDYLVASFDIAGTPRWLKRGGGIGDDEPRGLAVNSTTGDVFVTGFLQGFSGSADGGKNVVLRKYGTAAGVLQWTGLALGTSPAKANAGRGVALDSGGCAYIAGSFNDSTLNFQGFPSPNLGLPLGVEEMFVAKYCPACSNCAPVLTCTTNKTVECSSNWHFDPPTLQSVCCGTGATITVASTVTNGTPCHWEIIRTWQARDNCSSTSFCSQKVTVVDTTPPVISGCTNIVATLPNGQQTVMVNYVVTATDACSNPVTLTCTPPPGAFAAGVYPVHCVAVDACGNTNWCDFTITVRTTTTGTNCCDNCFPPYTASYSVVVQPGFNFIANVLCRSNMTLNGLLPSVPTDSMALRWNVAAQDFDPFTSDNFSGLDWDPNWTLALGEGFALYNPGNAYTNLFYGCEPTCPLPCRPTNNACQLVSGHGLGTNTWSNLYSCPPECGTTLSVFNTSIQDWVVYTYLDGSGWSPATPQWGPGLSVMVCVKANTNCCTNNLVLNGSFELTSPVVAAADYNNSLDPTTGVPGWTTTAGNYLEVWGNIYEGIPASRGVNHLEINAQNPYQVVSQVITNVSTNCMATFCFDYTGRFGLVGNTPNNDFTAALSGGYAMSVTLDPVAFATGGWQRYCVSFQPTASVITIQFIGHPHDSLTAGGAHIDNVSLTQCCPTNSCSAPLVVHCATNKTVVCGSGWSFDPPTVTNLCCGTNVTIAVLSTQTNGVCPLLITRTWLATDACGHSNTCSQSVTVNYPPPPQSWTPAAAMPTARWGAAAELLPSGRVLVAGGGVSSAQFLTVAEIYDPTLSGWAINVPLLPQAHRLTAVRLLDGQVLVAGDDPGASYTAYLYNETLNAWLPAGTPNSQHIQGTLTRLASGNVLLAGGYCGGGCTTYQTAEIYNSTLNVWNPTVSMAGSRLGHTATLMPSGRVLVAGGAQRTPVIIRSECELFSEVSATWSPAHAMNQFRIYHTATLLPNGKVLVVGGMTGPSSFDHYTATTEIYDPAANTWTTAASMSTPRALHTATLLACGKLLIAGGQNDSGSVNACEVYDYLSDSWSTTTPMFTARYRHTATLLPSGQVFITGGETVTPLGAGIASSEIYTPDCCGGTTPTHYSINTGTDSNGALLPPGSPEQIFVNVGTPVGTSQMVVINPATYPGIWVQPNGRSQWVGLNTDGSGPSGWYTNRWQFTLPCATATVTGQLATDDDGHVILNGVDITPASYYGFSAFGSVNHSANFVAGLNTLEIIVHNGGGPTGFRAELDVVSQCCFALPGSTNKTVPCGSPWSFDVPQVADPCSGFSAAPVVLGTVTNGLCPQAITRTWLFTNGCGFSNIVSQTVTVVDTTPPVIVCASNKTVECGTAWVYDAPTGYDACCTNVTFKLLNSNLVLSTPCRSVYQGIWLATDCCSNVSTCTQTVTVVDTTPPILVCANDKTAYSSQSWSFDPPSATDACSGTNVTINVASTVVVTNGPCVRTWTRTWTATDACGHTSRCQQSVTVMDTTPPALLQCPTNIIACLDTNGCGVMPDATGQVLASDPNGTVTITQSIPAGQLVCSNTIVIFTITDACGNATNCAATVELQLCCVKPPKGMVLWLTFDESVGVTCLNSMGGNNGVRYNGNAKATSTTGPTRQTGEYVNNSLCFDGVDDVVKVPSYGAINFGTKDFSIDAWVKWNGSTGTRYIVDKRDSGPLTGYSFYLNNGRPTLQLADGTSGIYSLTTAIQANQWTHLAVTVSRKSTSGVLFFIGGSQVGPPLNPTAHKGNLNNKGDLYVGNSPIANGPFGGCLDEIEIFNRVLTTNEVRDLYQAGTKGKCRPFCTVPSLVNICSGSVTISATICNPGAIGQWFGVSFTGLTAAQTGLPNAINWPASPNPFTPPGGMVWVAANSCVPIPFTITEPPGLASVWFGAQKKAVYQMIISSGGEKFTCLGTVVDQWWNCPVNPGTIYNNWATNYVILATNSTRVPIVLNNATNVPLTLNLIASVLDDQMMLETNAVSLNGLPPGTPVTEVITLPPGTNGTVTVDVSFTDPQPGTPFYLVLQADVGEGGAYEPVASITLLNTLPATVGPVLNLDVSSGQPVVSWDVVNSPFVLESIPDLGGTNWVPVLDPVVPLPDGSQGVILPPSAGSRFFRGSQ